MTGTLTLGDATFPVVQAELSFGRDEQGHGWSFNVACADADLPDEHPLWARTPRFYSELAPIDLDPIAPLSNQKLHVAAGWSSREPLLCLYVFEHDEVRNADLEFGEFQRGEGPFTLRATALVMGEPMTLAIDTTLRYVAP